MGHSILWNSCDDNECTVELQWLECLWNHENMFETGIVRASEIDNSARSGGIIRSSLIFYNMKVYVVCSHQNCLI